MKLYNLKDHNEQVSFAQAVKQGLGKQQGLFFPLELPEFELSEIDDMLAMDFVTRSSKILSAFIGDEIAPHQLNERLKTEADALRHELLSGLNPQELAITQRVLQQLLTATEAK